jgi:glycosyltransferase involved in cell wall biosynthesis
MNKHGFEASLVTNRVMDDLGSLKTEVAGLQLGTLANRGTRFFLERSMINYIRSEGKNMDVLHLFHLSRHTIIYGLLYKKVNPQGKLYLKLDAYNSHLAKRKKFSNNPIKQHILSRIEKRFHRLVDLITVENTAGVELAGATYPEWKERLKYLPNGVNDFFIDRWFTPPFKKENIILSVGRLGGEDKNYNLVLKALPLANLNGWKMRIIGPITDEFEVLIREFQNEFPEHRDKVEFVGPIYDRLELYKEYSKSRVFFLPSRFESFGISFVEAMYFGNVVVGHKGMAAYKDLSNSGEYGVFFEDNNPESFASAIEESLRLSERSDIQNQIHIRTKKEFSWSQLTKRLANYLNA